MTAVAKTRRGRKRLNGRWPGQSDWEAFGVFGVKRDAALKAAADMRRETVARLEAIDRFLGMPEGEYNALVGERESRKGVEALTEIRSWFSGELEIACRALGLDSGDVGELAAIHEYDHGYTRRQAENMALREFLQQAGRYDADTRALVETGKILDISRRFLDDMEAVKRIRKLQETA